MFSNTAVQEFFPTPVWTVDLLPAAAEDLNKELLRQLERLTSPRPPIQAGETWQTDPDLQMHAEFAPLMAVIKKATKAALDFLQIDYRDFAITGCWGNINPMGSLNSAHTHPNNFLSGVYYVTTPSGVDSIYFTDPRPAAAASMPRTRQLNRFNGNRMNVQVKPGRLILFPAWLTHGVAVNRSAEERVSFAFNVMFTEFAESMSKPLWKGSLPFRAQRS